MCDTIIAVGSATAAGAVLFGKNSDRQHDEAQYLELRAAVRHAPGETVRLTYKEIAQAPETHAVLLSKPHWIWGAEMGANAHGLVIGNEAIFSRIEASKAPGIIGMDYVRLALERARGVDEAVQVITCLLREHGQSGNCGFRRELAYHNSFILTDARGAKILETVDREWVVRSVRGHDALSNAMTTDEAWDSSSPMLEARAIQAGIHRGERAFAFKSVYEDSGRSLSGCYRRARAMELLVAQSGRLRLADFLGILRDHQEGPPIPGRSTPRICAHARESPIGQTTASWVSDLTPGKTVHWVTGTAAPCTGIFKPVLLGTGLPDHGPRPGADEDGVSLWWSHENLRCALDAGGAELRFAFAQERDALEAKFLDAMTKCPAVDEEGGRNEASAIVRRCWDEALSFESRWLDQLQG